MKYILITFVEFLQDKDQTQNVREFSILSNKTIYYRSNDMDGIMRYYTVTIPEFERNFNVNIEELVLEHGLVFK